MRSKKKRGDGGGWIADLVVKGGFFNIYLQIMCFGFLVAILLIFVICFSFFPFSGKKPSRKKNDKDEIETQWEKEGKKTEKM